MTTGALGRDATTTTGMGGGGWGQPPRSASVGGVALEPVRSNSGSSAGGMAVVGQGTQKRVGLQGMVDTNDGIMNMSIE